MRLGVGLWMGVYITFTVLFCLSSDLSRDGAECDIHRVCGF